MCNATPSQQQLQQLYNYIGWQAQRIDKLEQTVAKLSDELIAIKDQKRVHIDKIEYKFDQLKVERLEGTLTIGISPGTLDAIEDFTVNGTEMGDISQKSGMNGNDETTRAKSTKAAETAEGHDELFEQVTAHIQSYLDTQALEEMQSIEQKYGSSLDEGRRLLILNDIRNQIPARVQYYVEQVSVPKQGDYSEKVLLHIADKTKADIRTAMDMYMSKIQERKG